MPSEKKIVKKLLSVIKDDDVLKLRYYVERYKLNIGRLKVRPELQNLLHVACKYLSKNVIEYLMTVRGLVTEADSSGRFPVQILMEELARAGVRRLSSFAHLVARLQQQSREEDPFFQLSSFCSSFLPSFAHVFPPSAPLFGGFHSGAFERLFNFCNHFDPMRDTDEAWASKLEDEMRADHDDEWGRSYDEHVERPREETYDEWASRISAEYNNRHGHSSSSRTSRRSTHNDFSAEDQKKFEEQERELQRLREEKRKRKERKKYEARKKEYEEVCARIKASCNGSVIKPSRLPELVAQPSLELIRNTFFCDIEEKNERRKYLKDQMKIWHPDKFLHRIRNCVAEKHLSQIEEIAKRFCQILTELLTDIGC